MAISAHLCVVHPDPDLCLRAPQAMGNLHEDQLTLFVSFALG